MAYDNSGLRLERGAFAGQGPSKWSYRSADAAATVDGDGYISDGQKFGMRVGDLVEVQDTDTYLTTLHVVVSLSTTNDSVDLADGTTIGSATDSD